MLHILVLEGKPSVVYGCLRIGGLWQLTIIQLKHLYTFVSHETNS